MSKQRNPRQAPPDFRATLQRAVGLHRQGRAKEAERLYRAVLAVRPDQFDALHLLGVLSAQQGNYEQAVKFIARAIEKHPGSVDAHSNLGIALAALDRFDEALAAYDKALALKPDHADALFNRGIVLAKMSRHLEALVCYDRVLSLIPDHAEARFNRGVALARLNRCIEAIESYDKTLEIRPGHFAALYNRGNALARLGRHDEAVASFRQAIDIRPDHVNALNNLGASLSELRHYEEAIATYEKVLAISPGNVDAHYNRGVVLARLGRYEEAVSSYKNALAFAPAHVEALINCGAALGKLNRHAEAIACYDIVLANDPASVEALNNRGTALQALNRPEEALKAFERALAIRPDHVEAMINRGIALAALGRHEDAIESYDRALKLQPQNATAHYNRGNALHDLNRIEEAIASYDLALATRPDHAEALYNRGNALYTLRRRVEAIASYDRAIAVRPDYVEALNNRGNVLQELNRHEEAIASYEQALAIRPDYDSASASAAFSRAHICDWSRRDDDEKEYVGIARSEGRIAAPFPFLAFSHDPADQLLCAKHFVCGRHPAIAPPLWNGERYAHDRIRVAYLSADFHDHATAHLMAGLFEKHDRTRFEVIAISFGPERRSPMRMRLKNAFERFIDVRRASSLETASLLRRMEIDIAVDLKGFTTDSRPDIFARRPAPIQVNYLGYPGTMGAEYIDYIIADETVIPRDDRRHYLEKVVYLPDCYQVNDSKREIAAHTPTRSEAGLPQDGFVFCSFNNNYKITPAVFGVWMRLLGQVKGSVLWLLEGNPAAALNLRREAERRGISPKRLVFASRIALADHLARHRLADLFLDTLPYNAHTTASDALWAGLPVLTCLGTTFAGRVAASLLNAVGLPELITHSPEEYEALALRLATTPEMLKAIREKLARNRLTMPLFDTDRFRRHIEAAYAVMWEIYQGGGSPRSFTIAPGDA